MVTNQIIGSAYPSYTWSIKIPAQMDSRGINLKSAVSQWITKWSCIPLSTMDP